MEKQQQGERIMSNKSKTRSMVTLALFAAIIVVMTIVPYTGYISYGSFLEITTIHLVVILGAKVSGVKGGAILGGVWGITSMLRAFTNPLWIAFTNPLVSVVPRVIVGIVAGLVFVLLNRTKINKYLGVAITGGLATITNTILVLTALYLFGGMITGYEKIFELLNTIIGVTIGLNGGIEIISAIILLPIIYKGIEKQVQRNQE